MPDHYAVLGIERDADAESIKAAHRERARRHHPDLGGDHRAMLLVNEAWRVLRCPNARAAYDAARQGSSDASTTRRRPDGRLVLDFGRYAGRTLEEIVAVDDDYLAWLERSPASLSFRKDLRRVLDDHRQGLESLRPEPGPRRGWACR